MTEPGPTAGPPRPPAVLGPERRRFDGAFVGPMLPPPPPGEAAPGGQAAARAVAPGLPPVAEAVLAIPLGTRQLVSTALDLLTRTDAGLRSASFYIGFVMLLTIAPAISLLALAWLTLGDAALTAAEGDWAGWFGLATIPAALGYLAASVDARILATAVVGGRAEGRPLRLRESIALVRRRFWRVLGAEILVGIVTSAASFAASAAVASVIGIVDAVDFAVSLVVSLAVGAPFVYVTAGIVLGEVGVGEAIRRSIALVTARKRLAVVVTLFGVLSQLIVVLGLSAGLDSVFRLGLGTGLDQALHPALVVPVVAALVFAMGTLTFLVEAIAAAPAVYAFAALTHYTHGLELGRRQPLPVGRPWDPYLTRGLALGAVVALIGLVLGIAALPL